MKKSLLCSLAIVLLGSGSAWGWGGLGHIIHADLTLKSLPAEVRNFWSAEEQDLIRKVWSEAPDSHAVVAEDPRAQKILPQEDFDFLKGAGLKTYFQFHHPTYKSACVYLLARNFRAKNPKAAMFYAGILCHSTADPAAFNHGSLIHIYTYSKYKHVKNAINPELLDLGYAKKSPELRAKLHERLGSFVQKPSGKTLIETLGDAYLSRIGAATLMSTLEHKGVSPMPAPIDALAEIATYQTHESTRWITDAWAYAKSDVAFDLAPSFFPSKDGLVKICKSENENWKPRDPSLDGVYDGLFVPNAYPAVGIICEPTGIMNAARLGFRSRFLSACTARTLRAAGHSFRMLNVETLEKEELTPEKYPVIILYDINAFPKAKLLRAYLDQGGKLVYIGGRHDAGLTGMGKFFRIRKNEEVPVSTKYGIANQDVWQKMKVIRLSDGKVLPLMDNPNTPAGWAKPYGGVSITPEQGIRSLYDLDNGTERFCVGAINPQKTAVWLPTYLLEPFLLTNDHEMKDWAHPELDSLGKEVILSAIALVSDPAKTRQKK